MIFFQCVLILIFFCCPQRHSDSHLKWLSPLLSPLSSVHPMYSPMFHITSIQLQVCSLCASSCFRRMLWLLLCPMHVSVYVFAHTYVSVHVCMCIHHVYNKVYSKSIYYHDNRKIDTVTQDYVQQSVLIHVQASRLARGTLMWSLSTHNWSAYGINMANAAAA